MSRFLIELFYKGSRYAGFQVQDNANTIQAEVEQALRIYFRQTFELTGSSRTDAGVHARQNFFHFDSNLEESLLKEAPYHLNAILPEDIVIRSIRKVGHDFHCRFDAVSRSYEYCVYQRKDPFMMDRGYYFPYRLELARLEAAAAIIGQYEHFGAFSKKHTQVNTFICKIIQSSWEESEEGVLLYKVTANRFLRGMVRGLVGTMLRVGTGKIGVEELMGIIEGGDQRRADFSVPPQGLFLMRVDFQKD